MKYVLMSVLMMLGFGSYAVEILPYACKPLAITQATITLPKSTSSLVMINNVALTDLWITHPISEPSASAGWSSRIQSKHWSALAMGDKAFELGCIESKPGHEQQVPCSGVLMICQWPDIKITDKRAMPFWAGEDMSLPELLAYLSQHGFNLPEASK